VTDSGGPERSDGCKGGRVSLQSRLRSLEYFQAENNVTFLFFCCKKILFAAMKRKY
jgi:hypothetical protein